MPEQIPTEASSRLARLLGDRLVTTGAVRAEHGRDESPLPEAVPDAVAFPESEDDIVRIVQVCSEFEVPLIPFGAGTSLEGHVLATSGGISLDLTRMNEIQSVNVDDLDATAQAGVTRKQLNERLRTEGLFFPVDPGADATLGGMAATGASGTTTVRYGAMRDNVLSLRVVLPNGRVISTGRRARKTSAGYDLTRLFVGSEGTLGVITSISLRVFGIPEAISAAIASFSTIEAAMRTVITTLQMGIPVARVEFLDEMGMKAVSSYSGLDYPLGPTVFFEFHGSPTGVRQDTDSVRELANEHEALAFRSAVDGEERTRLWRARHDHFYASLALRPGTRAVTTDVCVPISRLGECILETRRHIDTTPLLATMAGHVGDGNFHVMFVIDPENADEVAAVEDLNTALVERALEMGGTCTGEHGIGLRKIGSLEKEMGPALDVMRSLKQALDPGGIMNPGKVLS